ncbi:MAG: hypothetical protein EB117_17135 [Betaproteobacteria bacterium]|nr:hypothetical protein [Betaproteobacteria bacterium]
MIDSKNVLTPHQLKFINYVKERKIPPNRREIALQMKVSPESANNTLIKLVRFGCLSSFRQRGKSNQMERFYVFVSMERTNFERPKQSVRIMRKKAFIYSDPFNLAGAKNERL